MKNKWKVVFNSHSLWFFNTKGLSSQVWKRSSQTKIKLSYSSVLQLRFSSRFGSVFCMFSDTLSFRSFSTGFSCKFRSCRDSVQSSNLSLKRIGWPGLPSHDVVNVHSSPTDWRKSCHWFPKSCDYVTSTYIYISAILLLASLFHPHPEARDLQFCHQNTLYRSNRGV